MRVLIAHFSQTGNTAKVARAIYEAVSSRGHEVDLKKTREITAEGLSDYGLVYLGSTCHDADLAKPVKRLLAEMDESPLFKLAGFVTHATYMPEDGERARELYERWAGNCIQTFRRVSEEKQIAFLGYFHCQGAPSPPIEAFIHNTIVTDPDEWDTFTGNLVILQGYDGFGDLRGVLEQWGRTGPTLVGGRVAYRGRVHVDPQP